MTAFVAVGAFTLYGQPTVTISAPPQPPTAVEVATITVHVSGAVVAPGLVEVSQNARVADVIAAAGGTTSLAASGSINLAAPVRDGEQVVVPTAGSAGVSPTDGDGRVRVNSATGAELEQIPGVGPVLAARIIAAREAIGGFSTVEDLLDVVGIGEAKLAGLRDYVAIP